MKQRPGAGLALAVLAAATFGSSGTFATSLFAAGWTPAAAVAARLVTAALVLTPFAVLALRRSHVSIGHALRPLTIFGLVAVAAGQVAFFNAVQNLSVGIALLLEYSGVLLVVAWLWLAHGQRPRMLTISGGVVALAGLALVLDILGGGDLNLEGLLWAAAAAVALASYFVLSAKTDDSLPPLVVAWGGLLIGGATVVAGGVVGALALAAPRTEVVLLGQEMSWVVPVLGLSLVAAVVAYVAGISASRLLGAKVASFVGLTEVLFAVALAWLLLGQSLTAMQAAGFALVIAGIALVRVDEPPSLAEPVAEPEQSVSSLELCRG